MGIDQPATRITTPIPIGVAFTVPIQVYSDRPPRTQSPITGKVVRVYVRNPGVTAPASAVAYTVTATSAALGQGTITLTGASHATTGTADVQVHVDGLLRARYQWEFVENFS
jgi:hypothetical protein